MQQVIIMAFANLQTILLPLKNPKTLSSQVVPLRLKEKRGGEGNRRRGGGRPLRKRLLSRVSPLWKRWRVPGPSAHSLSLSLHSQASQKWAPSYKVEESESCATQRPHNSIARGCLLNFIAFGWLLPQRNLARASDDMVCAIKNHIQFWSVNRKLRSFNLTFLRNRPLCRGFKFTSSQLNF